MSPLKKPRMIFLLSIVVLAALLFAGCARAPDEPVVRAQAQVHYATPTPGRAPVSAAPGVGVGVALSTFNTDDFAGSGQCVMCHEVLADAQGRDVSITSHWRSTMMANAARDPIWQAKVMSEVARTPGLQAVIEQKCGGCHTPMAGVQADVRNEPHMLLGAGFLNAKHPLHEAAIAGVSCSLCHQVTGDNLGQAESFSGGYEIDTSTDAPDRLMFGPYENPVAEVMQLQVGFLPESAPHTGSAEFCATCHNLITPYVDAKGEIAGEFPEQTPYTEWQSSTYGQAGLACQGCHMPQANGGVVISPIPANLPARQPFFQHYFVGGNVFMVNLMRDNTQATGATAETMHFEATIERTRQQLATAAALSIKQAKVEGSTFVLTLQVSPTTGHKFPTSFPSRRAWLHVTVKDGGGQVVFESGQPQPDGSIHGNAADEIPASFEPHYDEITTADQVQIYEPIMGDTDGNVTYTLLRAASYLKDNRLLPAGADKAALAADIAVYGAASGDANFAGGSDQVTYRVDVAAAKGPFTAEVELLYQPLSYRFLQDLLMEETSASVGQMLARQDNTPQRVGSTLIAEVK